MSKKFIALVLFAAMLISMIPVANAQVDYTGNYPAITVQQNGWYAGQNVENNIVLDGTDYIGSRLLNGKDTTGLKVTVNYNGATKQDSNDDYYVEVKLEGKYSELQPFYYTYLAQSGAMGYAVKIPVKLAVKDVNGTEHTNIAQTSYIAGTLGQYCTYPGTAVDDLYITVPLTAADGTYEYRVWYANSARSYVKVVWDNTDDNVSAAKNTAVPTLTVVGVAGDQKENFRADFTQAQWKYEKFNTTDANKTWVYYPGTLKFDIAAMTETDRVSILEDNGNTMTIKVKALDKAGYTYPQGTIVTFQGEANQNLYLGSSDKFVTVNAEASYLIDNAGCFTMTFSGIRNFAWIAGTGNLTAFDWAISHDLTDDQIKEYKALDDGNVYLYTLVSGGLKGIENNKYNNVVDGAFVLRFAYGNTAEELGFNLKFQNVARSKSGITLLSDVITVKVGDQCGIPYIVDNPMAMYQDLKVNWKIVNTGIADFVDNGTDTDGADNKDMVIKGKKVGTTYAFCTDQVDDVELVIINVVPADYVETPVVEEVEVGTKYVVTASKLNVREGASTSFKKVGSLTRNPVVTGTEVEGSVWVKLNDGGYVHGKYLAEVE